MEGSLNIGPREDVEYVIVADQQQFAQYASKTTTNWNICVICKQAEIASKDTAKSTIPKK